MISPKVKQAVKLSDLKGYEIAHLAEIHPSTLSRIINGIDEVKPGDRRVLRIARVLRLKAEECFEAD